jgi:hypothetical protein
VRQQLANVEFTARHVLNIWLFSKSQSWKAPVLPACLLLLMLLPALPLVAMAAA